MNNNGLIRRMNMNDNNNTRCVDISTSMLKSLYQSLEGLEKSLKRAKKTVMERGGGEELLSRVEQYEEISRKQRAFCSELQTAFDAENWEEVGRLTKLINGLSCMIKEDSKDILSSLIG